jgi:site-specific DNA recombinase
VRGTRLGGRGSGGRQRRFRFSRGPDRPGLQRILNGLAELDVIVFFRIDRFARSTVDFAEITRLAEHQSVALASATEPLDLTSSMGRGCAVLL